MDDQQAEKTFIHDISSPLMIAAGWLERWSRRDPGVADVEEFKKLSAQLEKIQGLVTKRREAILKQAEEET